MNRDLKAGSHEEVIERTLSGLRGVEVPAGLENRLLQAVRAADAAAGSTGRRAWFAGWRGWAGLGVACAAVLVVALGPVQGRNASRAGEKIADRVAVPVCRPVVGNTPAVLNQVRVDGDRAAARVRPARVSGRRMSLQRGRSLPVQEPPLTDEEKLLQRVARSGNQQEMALLNPEERAKEEASARAQFRAFTEQQY